MSGRQENLVVNEGTTDLELTVNISGSHLATNENSVKRKTLEICFNERIDREMGSKADSVKNRIQNAILIAIDSIFTPEIELAMRSINASFGQDAISVVAN